MKVYSCYRPGGQQERYALRKQVAETGTYSRGGDSLSEEKKIERRYGQCDVTITFKGSNPKLKDELFSLLCDSFENRVMNNDEQKEDTDKGA